MAAVQDRPAAGPEPVQGQGPRPGTAAERHADEPRGTRAVVGVVTRREGNHLTVHVRRGTAPGGGEVVTYRVPGRGSRVFKGDRRTTLDEIAVGDLVLVHALGAVPDGSDNGVLTAIHVHDLTPSRRALGA